MEARYWGGARIAETGTLRHAVVVPSCRGANECRYKGVVPSPELNLPAFIVRHVFFLFFWLFVYIGAGAAEAQPIESSRQRPVVRALRMSDDDDRIIVDGKLDEAVWGRAVPATDFIQQDPDNGQPATEQTEVRIVYTPDALYMGVICFDSEPDKWLGYQRRRDEFLQADDRFMWTIDTFLNERSRATSSR